VKKTAARDRLLGGCAALAIVSSKAEVELPRLQVSPITTEPRTARKHARRSDRRECATGLCRSPITIAWARGGDGAFDLLICDAAYTPRHYAEPGSDQAPSGQASDVPGLA
jgi:hypothetical protein